MEHDFELKIKPKAFGESAAYADYWKPNPCYQKALKGYDHSLVLLNVTNIVFVTLCDENATVAPATFCGQ
jgi:hypothetical protein